MSGSKLLGIEAPRRVGGFVMQELGVAGLSILCVSINFTWPRCGGWTKDHLLAVDFTTSVSPGTHNIQMGEVNVVIRDPEPPVTGESWHFRCIWRFTPQRFRGRSGHSDRKA